MIILRYLSIVQNHKWLLVQRQSSTFCSSKLGSYYACAIRWSQNSQLFFVLCSTAFSRESLVVIVISLEIILSVISINSRIFLEEEVLSSKFSMIAFGRKVYYCKFLILREYLVSRSRWFVLIRESIKSRIRTFHPYFL